MQAGRFLQFQGDIPHGNLYVGCMQAMGLNVTTFGNPEYCTGALKLG